MYYIQDISLDTESSDSCGDYKDVIEKLENDLNVARKDREDLMNDVADGIQEFLKEHPSTSLQLLVDRKCKDEIERLEKRICELESENSNLKAQIDGMRGWLMSIATYCPYSKLRERIASMKYIMDNLSMINVQLVTGIKRKYQTKANLV